MVCSSSRRSKRQARKLEERRMHSELTMERTSAPAVDEQQSDALVDST
jgi:hypothetical protein